MPIRSGHDAQALRDAALALARGELVAFPTETVYGLGARADDDAAVARIFAAKGRPSDHPLIVHVADLDGARHFAGTIGEDARRLAEAFWPGPVTIIVPRAPAVAHAAAAGQSTIGLRCPSHPVAQALLRACAECGVPGLAAPSANRFGRISPTTAAHVAAEFGPALPILDGGACEVGIESAIVDVSGDVPRLLRPGMIGTRQIETVLGCALGAASMQSPRVSGMLEAHYAPTTPLIMLTRDAITRLAPASEGPQVVLARCSAPAGAASAWMEAPEDPRGYAHELYRNLRALDAGGYARIIIEALPDTPEWAAVRDRLTRAARGAGNTGT